MDIVRILEQYCLNNNITFSHGRKSNLNLLKSNLNENEIYLLNEPTQRTQQANSLNTRVGSIVYKGNMFLLVKSNMDEQYFKEKNTNDTGSKFTKNIEPLLPVSIALHNYLMCSQLEVNLFDVFEAVNVLDTNKDGLIITYQITQDL